MFFYNLKYSDINLTQISLVFPAAKMMQKGTHEKGFYICLTRIPAPSFRFSAKKSSKSRRSISAQLRSPFPTPQKIQNSLGKPKRHSSYNLRPSKRRKPRRLITSQRLPYFSVILSLTNKHILSSAYAVMPLRFGLNQSLPCRLTNCFAERCV